MRKNYTKFFNLKLSLLAFVLFGMNNIAIAQCDVDPPAGAIYSEQFDGGLSDWTVSDLNGDPIDHFMWDADGTVCGGSFNACDGTNDFLISPSVCNGAVVMNADFLDNGGDVAVDGIFGDGDCPQANADGSFLQFCDALLASPVIDLSNSPTEVALQFTQGLREFNSEHYILLSNDGGVSYYDTIEVNGDIPTNSAHILDDTQIIPLCGAAGSAEFTMTFWYRANYYYWAIDDIALVPSNIPDARVNENFYATSPQYGTPFNMVYEMPFLADIENVSAALAVAPVLDVTVTDPDGNIVHSDSRTYDDVPGCRTDENKAFTNLYTPPNVPEAQGLYSTRYDLTVAGDENLENNFQEGNFEITNSSFKKVITESEAKAEYLDGIRYSAGSFQSFGSYFRIPQNEQNQAIESITAGIMPAAGMTLGVGEIVVAVYQWIDIEDIGTVNSGDANEKVKLGEASYFVTPDMTDFREFSVTPLDENGNMIIPEGGSDLIVMCHTNPFDGNINYFVLNSPDAANRDYYYAATQTAYSELGLPIRYGSFGGVGTTHDDRDEDRDFFSETRWTNLVNMQMTPPVGTEDINEDLAVTVYPSPASEILNIDVNFPELADKVNVQLVDMRGQLALSKNFSNIKSDKLTINVSQLQGGMYLMNIRTPEGMISKKISVIH